MSNLNVLWATCVLMTLCKLLRSCTAPWVHTRIMNSKELAKFVSTILTVRTLGLRLRLPARSVGFVRLRDCTLMF